MQQINKNELTPAEWIIYLEISRLQEKVLYHETFIKELRQDMIVIIKMIKDIKRN